MSDLSPMAQQILDYVRKYGGVSFVELEKHIEGFKGDKALYFSEYPNLILWPWVSQEATDALSSIFSLIEVKPCHFFVYMTDGKVPDMPIAKRAIAYKSEHWLPVTFSIKQQGKKLKGK